MYDVRKLQVSKKKKLQVSAVSETESQLWKKPKAQKIQNRNRTLCFYCKGDGLSLH